MLFANVLHVQSGLSKITLAHWFMVGLNTGKLVCHKLLWQTSLWFVYTLAD